MESPLQLLYPENFDHPARHMSRCWDYNRDSIPPEENLDCGQTYINDLSTTTFATLDNMNTYQKMLATPKVLRNMFPKAPPYTVPDAIENYTNLGDGSSSQNTNYAVYIFVIFFLVIGICALVYGLLK